MVTDHILPEHIPRILSDKPILEHFLRVLLGKPVTLTDWPSEAAWDDISAGSDLCAITTDDIRICLHVNLFGVDPLVDEVMHTAAQHFPNPVCTIVLTAFDPVDLGQSYSRIAPMVVDAPVITEMESVWQIHVLSFAKDIVNHNAPPEIQQLLNHMAGKEILPAHGSLLDRMLHEDFAWCPFADMRSRCKSSVYSYCTKQLAQGADRKSIYADAQCVAAHAISNFDLSELYAKLIRLAAHDPSDAEIRMYCDKIGIPAELYHDALAGRPWDVVNLLVWFDQRLQEESQRRRAALGKAGGKDGNMGTV